MKMMMKMSPQEVQEVPVSRKTMKRKKKQEECSVVEVSARLLVAFLLE